MRAVLGSSTISLNNPNWQVYKTTIVSQKTEAHAKLKLTFTGHGIVTLDRVSLFPQDTWKGQANVLRKDLVQLLADLKPGFIRFPGGCIVEGRTLEQRYQWKKTIGPLESRELLINRWNNEFKHRPTPDYFQSFGLGFFEYFQLAEDIGAEPLRILGCGMACQFNTGELAPLSDMDVYLQDALDLIEFANGPIESTWGKVRATMGHPKSFQLKYLGIGNEQWGDEYFSRLTIFMDAVRKKYPEIKIITSAGPGSDGEHFDLAGRELRKLKAELVDEHYYKKPEWFLNNASRYDAYDRNSFKIFAGEYAAQSSDVVNPDNKNNWKCALAEAAYMTGLERNADVVHMTSYAHLFAHTEAWQWTPNLIWFDNLQAYGTPNHRGTHVLPTSAGGKPLTGNQSLYASSVWDETTGEIIVKLVNTAQQEQIITLEPEGAKKIAPDAKLIQMSSATDDVENSIEHPKQIVPIETTLKVKGKKIPLKLPGNSVSVLRVKTN